MLKHILQRPSNTVDVLLMILVMGPFMMSAMVSLETGEGHWFQRSGSLMVLFAAATEYRRQMLRQAGERPHIWGRIPYVCYLFIALGTVTWGYGDLFFKN
jgi:hypothetical protein